MRGEMGEMGEMGQVMEGGRRREGKKEATREAARADPDLFWILSYHGVLEVKNMVFYLAVRLPLLLRQIFKTIPVARLS